MASTLAQEVLKVAFQFGKVNIRQGIVYVHRPNGEIWRTTHSAIVNWPSFCEECGYRIHDPSRKLCAGCERAASQ